LYDSALAAGLENIMLETDCPYMAPQSRRGKRNDSTTVADVAATLAQWFGVTVAEIATVTTANAKRFFRLT